MTFAFQGSGFLPEGGMKSMLFLPKQVERQFQERVTSLQFFLNASIPD